MTASRPSNRPIVFVALLAAAVAAAAWLHVPEHDADWGRVRARGSAMAAAAERGARPHAPLRGEPTAGDATAHYRRATAEHDRAQHVHAQRCSLAAAADVADLIEQRELPADAGERLAPFANALASLAAGAASDRIHFGEFWKQFEYDAAGVPLGPVADFVGFPVAKIALVAARHELAAGRAELALQRTADALTLARDQLQVGVPMYELIGADTVEACCAAWPDRALQRLAPSLLRDFAEVLRRFDEATPADAVASTLAGCRLLAEDAFRDPQRGSWRQLAAWAFTPPENRTPTAPQIDAYFDAVEALPPPSAPWSTREPALAAAGALLPQLAAFGPVDTERVRRGTLARVRLLRMAIVHHLGEPIPPLGDPFGDGELRVTEEGCGLRFSSCGVTTGMHDRGPLERRVEKR